MPELTLLRDIVLLLCLALVNAVFFSKIRLSPVVGYLLTGMLVGPYGFHLIDGTHEVELLAEIGVVLLLFTVGLEFSFTRILRLKGLMLRSGTTQVLLTALVVFLVALLFGLPPRTAAILGMALALSSTAIVLKLLLEKGEIDSAHGRVSLAILLFQDLSVVLFLLLLPVLGGQMKTFSPWAIVKGGVLLGGLFVFSRHLLRPLLLAVLRTRIPELFRLTILAVVLGTAWVTGEAGLSLALGAFLAGLALAESEYSHQVLVDIMPFRDVFLALFFVSVGMLLDGRNLVVHWPVVLIGFLALTAVKIVTGTLGGLLARYPLQTALVSGLMLFQVGEFSFVILREAVDLRVVPVEVYQIALAIVALSMMVTPFVVSQAGAVALFLGGSFGPAIAEDRERTANLEDHVVIAGYGLSARNVAQVLREVRIPYIHVEINGEAVTRARAAGEFIMYGDATSPAVLEAVGLQRARALVVAVNDPSAGARSIQAARGLSPNIYILARTRFALELDHLVSLGADDVIPDEFEASLQMAAALLRRFSTPDGTVMKLIAALRQRHYGGLRKPLSPPADLARYLSALEGGRIEFQAVPEASPHLGKTLVEIQFRTRTGATVVGLVRDARITYTPPGDLLLERGDTLILLGSPEDLEKARHLLHGRLDTAGDQSSPSRDAQPS